MVAFLVVYLTHGCVVTREGNHFLHFEINMFFTHTSFISKKKRQINEFDV
jgi:hypothetical protein